MSNIEIIVGTTLGGAEYVADELAEKLQQLNHTTKVWLTPELDKLDFSSLWLIVSSTHGAGDLPDNLLPFYQKLLTSEQDFSTVKFAICAIGDSSYDTFCYGPEKLIQILEDKGSKQIVDKIQIDIQYDPIPEDQAVKWLNKWCDRI